MRDDTLLIILGNQLFSKKYIARAKTNHIFIAEDYDLCTEFKYHKLKIYLFFSAMRKFRDEMKGYGYKVNYHSLEDRNNNESYLDLLLNFLVEKKIKSVKFFEIEDKPFESRLKDRLTRGKISYEEMSSPMFLCSREEFKKFSDNKKNLRMVDFYKLMRRKTALLMDKENKPIGNKWSYDEENRKKIPKNTKLPEIKFHRDEKTYKKLKEIIDGNFSNHPGQLEPWFPDNRKDSLSSFRNFLKNRFEFFGTYEDALVNGENFLFHSLLSPSLNIGLLTPEEIIYELNKFLKTNDIPINSLEGFIRQIIGWREFIRGVYQIKSTEQIDSNFWNHKNKFRESWYTAKTGLDPLDDVINSVNKYGYTHHIPRLMILSNLMTLCEINPKEIYKWFMEMFIDSSEWVMVPNVFGMGTFADGGLMSTKPYTCGSNYILKMSNYPKGDWCEIVDGLYWRFMDKNKEFYGSNPRLALITKSLEKMDKKRKKRIFNKAEKFISENVK